MARQYIFICDGCDQRVTGKSSDRPTYWADVGVTIHGFTNWTSGGSKELQVDRLLCGACQIILRDQADPKSWVRNTAEGKNNG